MHVLSQFMQASKEDYWEAALRVVRYLKGNLGHGVLLRKDCDLQLSYWIECPLTCRSFTGWFVLLGSFLITWKTKNNKQYLAHLLKLSIDP